MLTFAELLEDPIDPADAYGGDPLVLGLTVAERFPHQVSDFKVVAALEGPQNLITWTPPLETVDRLVIVRKQGEYPRHRTDGVVIVNTTDLSIDAVIDLGDDLVADPALGASAWWYYRAFSLPSNLLLADQFAGRAAQVIDEAPFETLPIDVQAFRNLTVIATDRDEGINNAVQVQTAPTLDGPWVQVGEMEFDLGLPAQGASLFLEFTDVAFKYLRCTSVFAFGAQVVAQRSTYWQTSAHASAICLAYRSGYHLDVLWNRGHIPDFWRVADSDSSRRDDVLALRELGNEDATLANLADAGEERGPLYRFLKFLTFEMDRAKAQLDALQVGFPDITKAPPHVLEHVAYTMGWEFDSLRPFNDIRAELLRRATEWRMKGGANLLEGLISQVMHLIPRVQRGGGLLFRVADPDQL